MKRSNKDETIIHYIPEFYNDYVDESTGKERGWTQLEYFKKPYTSRKWAEAAIDYRRGNDVDKEKYRIRIETFKCVDVKFEEI